MKIHIYDRPRNYYLAFVNIIASICRRKKGYIFSQGTRQYNKEMSKQLNMEVL